MWIELRRSCFHWDMNVAIVFVKLTSSSILSFDICGKAFASCGICSNSTFIQPNFEDYAAPHSLSFWAISHVSHTHSFFPYLSPFGFLYNKATDSIKWLQEYIISLIRFIAHFYINCLNMNERLMFSTKCFTSFFDFFFLFFVGFFFFI